MHCLLLESVLIRIRPIVTVVSALLGAVGRRSFEERLDDEVKIVAVRSQAIAAYIGAYLA